MVNGIQRLSPVGAVCQSPSDDDDFEALEEGVAALRPALG